MGYWHDVSQFICYEIVVFTNDWIFLSLCVISMRLLYVLSLCMSEVVYYELFMDSMLKPSPPIPFHIVLANCDQ